MENSQQLISIQYNNKTGETQATLNKNCVDLINKNFNRSLPINILAFGGNIGLGKSTCWSTIAMLLDPQINLTGQEVFRTSDSLKSFTKGIHCLPKPVFHSSNKNVQILLLDIEGMGGINEGIYEYTQKTIQSQLDMIAMILSSNYVMMSNLRPNSSIISQLGIYFENLMEMKEDLQISAPQFTILIKDRRKELNPQETLDFNQMIQQSLGLSDDLMENMVFECLAKYPDEIEDDEKKDYKIMKNTKYAQSLENLIIKNVSNIKQDLVIQQDMKLDKFCQLIEQSVNCLNSEDFKLYFVQNLEKYVLDLTNPYYLEFENTFSQSLEHYLSSINVLQTSQQQFNGESQNRFQTALEDMIQVIMEKIPRISDSENPKHKQLLAKIVESYTKNLNILLSKYQQKFELIRVDNQLQFEQQNNQIKLNNMNNEINSLENKMQEQQNLNKQEQEILQKNIIDLQKQKQIDQEIAQEKMDNLQQDFIFELQKLQQLQDQQNKEWEDRLKQLQNQKNGDDKENDIILKSLDIFKTMVDDVCDNKNSQKKNSKKKKKK